MREEYEAIHRAGLVLQLDCPDLAMTAPGAGSLENFRRQVELTSRRSTTRSPIFPPRPSASTSAGATARCRGPRDVELKDIIDIVLKAKPAGLMLMASNGRHAHEWKVFQDVKLPDGKYVIPGVLDSTTNVVEHPEVVADRLIRYAEVVGRDNVMAGTDCGFGTIAGMDPVVPTVTWAKFRSQAQGAEIASDHLWGVPPEPAWNTATATPARIQAIRPDSDTAGPQRTSRTGHRTGSRAGVAAGLPCRRGDADGQIPGSQGDRPGWSPPSGLESSFRGHARRSPPTWTPRSKSVPARAPSRRQTHPALGRPQLTDGRSA